MKTLKNNTKRNYKGLTMDSEKLDKISIHPKVKNGKVQLDKNNLAHRYIFED